MAPMQIVVTAFVLALLCGPVIAQPAAEPNPKTPPASAAPLEIPKPAAAAKFLGAALTSPNYTVRPIARSDGLMRIFEVETPYGQFQFDGAEFAKLRLREIDATVALEKMSTSEAFAQSFGNQVLAPLKFSMDFIANPADAMNRSASGIQNFFDRGSAAVAGQKFERDNALDSLLGVSDAQRQLAVELKVDPYTDFAPLQDRLHQVAAAMAGGSLTVRGGLAAVTGGVGLAISATSGLQGAMDTLRDKTAAQVLAEVRTTLSSLGVPDDTTDRLIGNRYYTPTFLLLIARSLKQLQAQNTAAFVDRAADVNSYGLAYFNVCRAVLLAARSAELGGLVAFTVVGGHAVNIARDGKAVILFPLDDLAWTDVTRRTFLKANAELRQRNSTGGVMLATTGLVTPLAAAEIQKLGWKIVNIKPIR